MSQIFDSSKMDSLFSLINMENKGMGSISIFDTTGEVYKKSIGYAQIENEFYADGQTQYNIGSITKIFTAVVIIQLIEEGKLNFETKLSEFYPNIENANSITIELMLRHRSGIFNFTNSRDYFEWDQDSISKIDLIDKISITEASFKPSHDFEYSNSNYALLAFIAEELEQVDFDDIIRKRICTPCALEILDKSKNDQEIIKANSYSKYKNWKISSRTDASVLVGSGHLLANPSELNSFLFCLFNGKLVSQENLAAMMTIQYGFGMGLIQVPFYDKKAFGHSGGIDGYRSNSFYFPQEKIAISYLSNAVDMPINDIMIGALSIYFDKKYELPIFSKKLELAPETLDNFIGTYSGSAFPLKVTITREQGSLVGQATGQPNFPLEAFDENKFKYDLANLKLIFDHTEKKMTLIQNGAEYVLKKEE